MEHFALRLIDGVNVLVLLVLVWILIRVINDAGNLIIWADYISTRGTDGKQHGDINKVGQLAGITLSVLVVLIYAGKVAADAIGLSALLGVALVFLGAPTMYAGWIRSKQGSIETSKVTEVAPSAKVTETVTQTAPIGDKP